MSGGPILAFDTSIPPASVAVGRAGRVSAWRVVPEGARHSEALAGAIEEVLNEAEVELGEIAGLAVGSGPGSFTGVRVAVATAKGLAHGRGFPVWAFSSLHAQAASVAASSDVGASLHVLFDARGDRLFAAGFAIPGDGGVPSVVDRPSFTTVPELCTRLEGMAVSFTGSGAERHRSILEGEGHRVFVGSGLPGQRASGLVLLQSGGADAPLSDVRGWQPDYLRAPSAVRARQSADEDAR